MARYVISLTLSLTAFGFSSPGWSQQPSAPVGAVTGHVICGDTERPARFAQVTLFGVPAEVAPAPKSDAAPDSTKTRALITKAISQANWIQTQTDLEGNFSATGVAPGDYYVFASMPGYVEPNNVVQAAIDGGADLKRSIPGVPRIHVAAEHTAQAEVTVERGAAISGHVLWDDGAPVTRAYVTTVNTKAQEREIPHEFSVVGLRPGDASMTDDLGHFRLSGLEPGDYLIQVKVETTFHAGMQGGVVNVVNSAESSALEVYAPAAFHKEGAKAVMLHTAEDRGDAEVTIRLAGLRTVSGRVASAEDHHGLNSAKVKLQDAKDKEFARGAGVDANGEFKVMFVPPGTYNLVVSDVADTETKLTSQGPFTFPSKHILRSYQEAKQTLIVADDDVTGMSIEAVPDKTVKKDEEPSATFSTSDQ